MSTNENVLYERLKMLCEKYNISFGGESLGFGAELARLPYSIPFNSSKCQTCKYNTNDYVCHPHCGGCDGRSKYECKGLKFYKTIAVDFDGTLCENNFPDIGEPKPLVIEYIKRQQADGAHIILHTCRENGTKRALLDEALEFCAEQGIELYSVNENPDNIFPDEYGTGIDGRKLYADVYIDDKAINTADIESAMREILEKE